MARRILLAEDDFQCLEVIKMSIEKNGHCITCAQDGQDALDTLRNSPFDLAILDVQMPKLNGIEVVKCIRLLNKDLPVIFMTGHSQKELC